MAPRPPLHLPDFEAMARNSFSTRTVVVLGASYGGARAARMLSQTLPAGWRLVVIDRNSHMNHVYVFPRFSILPQHAAKGFIPYTRMLAHRPAVPPSAIPLATSKRIIESSSPPALTPSSSSVSLNSMYSAPPTNLHVDGNEFIQASITSLSRHSVTFVRPQARLGCRRRSSALSINSLSSVATYGEFDGPEETLQFDYCIYALGSGMPDPCNVWNEHPNMPSGVARDTPALGPGSKKGGIRWMKYKASQLEKAERIVIVGGGALGIQFATDLKELYPAKSITLLHSRTRLMHLYPIAMHTAVIDKLNKLNINTVLGERVMTWPEDPEVLNGERKIVRTDKGRVFEADLVLPCTGQKPHSTLMAALSPTSINPLTNRIRVEPTLQISAGPSRPAQPRQHTGERLSTLALQPPPSATPPSSRGSDSSDPEGDEAEEDFSHMFAIGDCADTGAIQAGHTAYWQAEVAARNIMRLIEEDEGSAAATASALGKTGAGQVELEVYKPGPPNIKISLGLKSEASANGDEVTVSENGVEDLKALTMWPMLDAAGLDVNA